MNMRITQKNETQKMLQQMIDNVDERNPKHAATNDHDNLEERNLEHATKNDKDNV